MYKLKFNYFTSVAIFSVFNSVKSEFMCDKYLNNDGNNAFFTIAEYNIPPNKYTQKLNESVPCPCSTVQPCLRKCCLGDDIFVSSTKHCRHFDDLVSQEDRKSEFKNIPNIHYGNYTLIYGSFCPSTGRLIEKANVLEDGSLDLQDYVLPLDKYCIEYFHDKNDFGILECNEQVPKQKTSIQKTFITCLALSIFCSIITLLTYSCLEKLQNLPGKILRCYVTSLLMSETCLMGLLIFPVPPGIICVTAAYTFQFSFSATFFWLNVMCFDLWLVFRRDRFPKQPPGVDRNSKKFIIYCLYAWGMPLIICTITMLIELSVIPGEFLKPEIGQSSCWFKTHEATFWYFYSYTSVLLLLNLYMFLTTLCNFIKKERKVKEIFTRDGNKRHNEQEKQRFFLYLKLFLIMGINWIMDMLSYYMRNIEKMKYIWLITDLTSTLQGFLILLIFVCNRKVLGFLNEKLYPGNKNRTRNNSCSTSTTICSQKENAKTSIKEKIHISLPNQIMKNHSVLNEQNIPDKSGESV